MVKIMEVENNKLNEQIQYKDDVIRKKEDELKVRLDINDRLEKEICKMKNHNFMVQEDKDWIEKARNEVLEQKTKINDDARTNKELKDELEKLRKNQASEKEAYAAEIQKVEN